MKEVGRVRERVERREEVGEGEMEQVSDRLVSEEKIHVHVQWHISLTSTVSTADLLIV